ncbi:MAG: DUF433 domain-containing protein [Gemmatimonadetes bacterium]|nr:DUF433 domain-containing protein [Gemmatimonadota bacterium]
MSSVAKLTWGGVRTRGPVHVYPGLSPAAFAVATLKRERSPGWREVDVNAERPIALPDGRVFHSDSRILGDTPVFVGTRVPVRTLLEYLEGGYSLDQYLDSFPTVRREQAVAFLEEAARALLEKVA